MNSDLVDNSPLAFLDDGSTTREAVEAEFGNPSRRFENGRILTYQLDENFRVIKYASGPGVNYLSVAQGHFSLVLIFGDDGVLLRHRVIRVR